MFVIHIILFTSMIEKLKFILFPLPSGPQDISYSLV